MHPALLLVALLILAYAAAEQPAVARKSRKRTRNSEAGTRSVRYTDAYTKKRRAVASSLAFSTEAESESFEFESDEGVIRRPRLQQADSKLNFVKNKLAGVRNEIGERAVGAAHKASKLLRELRGHL
jgi:hypothetical protein